MFKITAEDGNARIGKLKTRHGIIETPFFMPVATRAVGKYIGTEDYKKIGVNAIISNSLVLSFNPSLEVIKKAGGIHKFMNFNKVIFTDCGGFQVSRNSFSSKQVEKGIYFKNPYDKSNHFITPKRSMEIQQTIKSDVAVSFDDMAPYGSNKKRFEKAVEKTHHWAKESLKYHKDKKQLLFGISQGGFHKDLRKKSARDINSLDFDGVAIGGVAIGEPKNEMYLAIKSALPEISKNKPRYVMGVGSPQDIVEMISLGIDCFDSIFPASNGRHGTMFTSKGKLNINKGMYKLDLSSIDKNCNCFTCKNYSKSYIRHLSMIKEPEGMRLKTIHNLQFMMNLIKKIKIAIKNKKLNKFKKNFYKYYPLKVKNES